MRLTYEDSVQLRPSQSKRLLFSYTEEKLIRFWDKTPPEHFRGIPLYQATKRHLNNS